MKKIKMEIVVSIFIIGFFASSCKEKLHLEQSNLENFANDTLAECRLSTGQTAGQREWKNFISGYRACLCGVAIGVKEEA